ncbi:aspartyl/asparaginyl beta-hydroxylase domain-containing protein [Alteromonas facilis]|uniref:aspartyl/asparaginyl beta-hydroxylase domain-containing protein n=1 Tax=Alteromonas facilis TaxID=2048004 RepID=UPI000C281692|nr:aspartyl/asparaginyl beta-hydroxylase domain-containing protein [Alteromonas facilis]
MKQIVSHIETALSQKQYSQALSLYLEWFLACENNVNVIQSWHPQHLANAASLARRDFFERVSPSASQSTRCKKALSNFIGLHEEPWQNDLQQPSFFYFPDLMAKPFYKAEEIEGLETAVDIINNDLPLLKSLAASCEKSYVDHIGGVPNTEEWHKLKETWRSFHLISGSGGNSDISPMPDSIDYLQDEILPSCSPLAPEVFISNLETDAYIPPHFGLSNIKLTVHVPLRVNNKAWLKAGGEKFTWHENDNCMVFDDSFEHSAKNGGEEMRSVLIFDVWHPDLSEYEKNFIEVFVTQHNQWSESFGKLAGLDK